MFAVASPVTVNDVLEGGRPQHVLTKVDFDASGSPTTVTPNLLSYGFEAESRKIIRKTSIPGKSDGASWTCVEYEHRLEPGDDHTNLNVCWTDDNKEYTVLSPDGSQQAYKFPILDHGTVKGMENMRMTGNQIGVGRAS